MALNFSSQPTLGWYSLQSKLDLSHELVRLAAKIDWDGICEALRPYYKARGRRHLPIRLMVGLHLLKHRFNLSDAMVVGFLRENWYWMYFCDVSPEWMMGEGKRVLERSSMSRFRGRIGDKGVAAIEKILRDQMQAEGLIDPKRMTTDSTAMEKNIAYPTDSSLLDRGRRRLVKIVVSLTRQGVKGLKNFRTYAKKGKKALLAIVKLGKDRKERIQTKTLELAQLARHVVTQTKKMLVRAKRQLGKTDNFLRREALKETIRQGCQLLRQVAHVIRQSRERFKGRHVKNKLYSYHEPQVTVIQKGKRSKPTEYGCKVNLAIDSNGIIVSHQEYTKNHHDSTLLEPALKAWEQATGRLPDQLNVDRGYRQKQENRTRRYHNIPRICIPPSGNAVSPDKDKRWYRRGLSLRAGIEAVIGHLKQDHRMNKSRYQGFRGDKINTGWAIMAWNTKKWMRLAPV